MTFNPDQIVKAAEQAADLAYKSSPFNGQSAYESATLAVGRTTSSLVVANMLEASQREHQGTVDPHPQNRSRGD